MALFWVVWEYTALVMNDIQLAVPVCWVLLMARAVFSHTTLNAIQYYIITYELHSNYVYSVNEKKKSENFTLLKLHSKRTKIYS